MFPANPYSRQGRLTPAEFKPYDQMVLSLFKEMGSESATLMHAAVGVMGEAVELRMAVILNDRENVIEEAGDAFFYLQKILSMYGWNPHTFAVPSATELMTTAGFQDPAERLMHEAGTILDLIKKVWVYERPIDQVVLCKAVGRFMYHFFDTLQGFGIDFDGVLEYNQIKLAKRYPSGVYTNQDAQARADKAPGE